MKPTLAAILLALPALAHARDLTPIEGAWILVSGPCKDTLLLSRTDRGFAAEFRSYRQMPDENGEPQTVEVREAVAATAGSLHNEGGWKSTLELEPTRISYSTGHTAPIASKSEAEVYRATWAFGLRADGNLGMRYQVSTFENASEVDRTCVYRRKPTVAAATASRR